MEKYYEFSSASPRVIRIVPGVVMMPVPAKRRFQKASADGGKTWSVVDMDMDEVVYVGKFEGASLAAHNLNKAYYRVKKTEE